MKKVSIYIAGVIMGAILVVLIAILLTKSYNNGITMFDQPGDYIEGTRFKVFQVIDSGFALTNCERMIGEGHRGTPSFLGPVVLFINDEGRYYYDDEIIEVAQGKRARQIGIYKYSTKVGYKTVPIVKVME